MNILGVNNVQNCNFKSTPVRSCHTPDLKFILLNILWVVCVLWSAKGWCTHQFSIMFFPRGHYNTYTYNVYITFSSSPPSEQLYIRGVNLCCDITQCMPQETNTVVVLSLLLFNGVVKGGRRCVACTGNAVSSLQPCHSHNVPTNAPQMLACSDSTVGAPFSPHPLIWG